MSNRPRPGKKERQAAQKAMLAFYSSRREADDASRIVERSPLRSSADRANLKVHASGGFVEAKARLGSLEKRFIRS